MSKYVPVALRRFVRQRARLLCEYCLLHEDDVLFPHGVDHVTASKHGGKTEQENLAWACFWCNGFKASDLASVDMETGQIVRLFNPRRDKWSRHFRLEGALIIPLTPIGRVTEYLLKLNLPRLVQAREHLMQQSRYPSQSS